MHFLCNLLCFPRHILPSIQGLSLPTRAWSAVSGCPAESGCRAGLIRSPILGRLLMLPFCALAKDMPPSPQRPTGHGHSPDRPLLHMALMLGLELQARGLQELFLAVWAPGREMKSQPLPSPQGSQAGYPASPRHTHTATLEQCTAL